MLLIGYWSASFGNGNYVLARILFPFACLDLGPWGTMFIVLPLALIQWPLYGYLLDNSHMVVCIWLFTKGSWAFV
jgi:hypothetical protein